MPIVQDVPVSDIRVPDLSLGAIRAWAVYHIVTQNAIVLKGAGDSRIKDLQALKQSIIGLQELFSAHHSKIFLDQVQGIEDELDSLWPQASDMIIGQKYARKLMEWFGLIARYLLPHEGIGEVREGAIRFSVFADEVMTGEDQTYIKTIEATKELWEKKFISKEEFEKVEDNAKAEV
jgi:hypothetical protein|tara:strand:- start:1905 stop:2435 length:531 start_codon:yes stop_codon:yes gene_type:complete